VYCDSHHKCQSVVLALHARAQEGLEVVVEEVFVGVLLFLPLLLLLPTTLLWHASVCVAHLTLTGAAALLSTMRAVVLVRGNLGIVLIFAARSSKRRHKAR
jgi:hypothetical protein